MKNCLNFRNIRYSKAFKLFVVNAYTYAIAYIENLLFVITHTHYYLQCRVLNSRQNCLFHNQAHTIFQMHVASFIYNGRPFERHRA